MVKISELTALTAVAADDVLPINDTSEAAETKRVTVATLAASPVVAGVVPGLVENDQGAATANRVAIQAALDAAATVGAVRPAFTGTGGEGGGTVRLPVGFYYVDKAATGNRALTLPHAVELAGSGWGTVLALANGQGSAASPCTVIKVADGAAGSVVRDLRVWGNRANQTDTNHASHGIDLNRAGPTLELYDGHLAVRDVVVFGCEGWGVNADGSADTAALRNVSAYHNYAGFNCRTDQTWVGCIAGNNDTDGFKLYAGTGTRFSGCKAFGGQVGWNLSYCKMIHLAACLAEDTAVYGWDLTALTDTTLAACGAYRSVSGSSVRAALALKDDGAGTLPARVSITGFTALGETASGGIVEFNQAFRFGLVGVGCSLHATAAGYTTLVDDMTGGANPATGDMDVVINGTSLGVSPYP